MEQLLAVSVATHRTLLVLGVGLLLTAAFWAVVPPLRRFEAPTSVADGQFA